MKKFLEKVRIPDRTSSLAKKVSNSALVLLLGITLGTISKWLDNLSINDAILWQRIIEYLDLGNVFSGFGVWIFCAVTISVFSQSPLRAGLNVFLFFLGMNTSYHLYTVLFSGFNPSRYMMIWYTLTLFTPFLAYICWYAKGKGTLSLSLAIGILLVMLLEVQIGAGHILVNIILFFLTIGVLHTTPKRTLYSLMGAVAAGMLFHILRYL